MKTHRIADSLTLVLVLLTGFVSSAAAQEALGPANYAPTDLSKLTLNNEVSDNLMRAFLNDYWRGLSSSDRKEICYQWRNNRHSVELLMALVFPQEEPNSLRIRKMQRVFFK